MADEWQAGDLALCVKKIADDELLIGSINTVCEVFVGRSSRTGELIAALNFKGVSSKRFDGFAAHRFTKIKPLTDEEIRSFVAELDCPVVQPNHEVAQALRTDRREAAPRD